MSGKTFFSFLSGRRLGGDVSIGRSLRYTPCSQQELRLESGSQDLEEISVIHQEGGVFANGPRVQGIEFFLLVHSYKLIINLIIIML